MQAGAIFDWDGVVIDSSAAHEESWKRLAKECGMPLPGNHFKKGFGMKNEFIIPNILNWADGRDEIQKLSLRKESLYREIVRERGIEPLPGVREFLEILSAHGIPCAVGSSTHRENIQTIMDLIGVRTFFSAIVTAEDVSHGKPDPEVFLKCAEKISRPPARCVVFEDAHVGIDAAQAGGMKAVAVATTHSLDQLGKADLAVHRLSDITWDQIKSLLED